METETIWRTSSYCYIKTHQSILHFEWILYLCMILENIGLLNHVYLPSIATFHYILSKNCIIIDIIRIVFKYWEHVKVIVVDTNFSNVLFSFEMPAPDGILSFGSWVTLLIFRFLCTPGDSLCFLSNKALYLAIFKAFTKFFGRFWCSKN